MNSAAQHTPGPRLSAAQVFVLSEVRLGLDQQLYRSIYGRTLNALTDKGLLIRLRNGRYVLSDTGAFVLVEVLKARRAALAQSTHPQEARS